MKLKRLSIQDHPVLGSLELDFMKDNGTIADTVILTWENGTGKTQILEILWKIAAGGMWEHNGLYRSKEKYIAEWVFSEEEMEVLKTPESGWHNSWVSSVKDNTFILEADFSQGTSGWDKLKYVNKKDWQEKNNYIRNLKKDKATISVFKAIFMGTDINFWFQPIKQITALDTDQEVLQLVKSNGNIWTTIAQLFVNIYNFDNAEVVKWGKNNPWKVIPAEVYDKRQWRFKKAFSLMFPNKKYEEVAENDNTYQVMFQEHWKKMSLDKLSSGEKQIVFRGSFLLKDKQNTNGAVVLVDEPEISLHPSWQLKILDFYKQLFTDTDWIQQSQLFIATHSPFIIHNSQRFNDKAISLSKDKDWKVFVEAEPTYFWYSQPEFIKESFDLDNFIEEKPLILTEWKNYKYLQKAKELFAPDLDIEIKEIKENNSSQLRSIYEALYKVERQRNKVFFIWDCDCSTDNKIKRLKETDLLKPIILSKNENNTKLTHWIENMFNEDYLPNLEDKKWWLEEAEKAGWFKKIQELDKNKLQEYLLSQANTESFANFKVVFEKIKEELGV